MSSKKNLNAKSDAANANTEAAVINLYAAAEKIYPRSTFGFFTKWRWVMIWLTQLFFYGVPWIEWGQRQALLFDLEARRFYIFNLVLYPQDLIYLTGILIISALSLFLFTAIAGRLWCGYTCPQTVYTEIFLWIEAKIEGDRAARIRLDDAPMSARKLLKKGGKHFVWIAFAIWTGFTYRWLFHTDSGAGRCCCKHGFRPLADVLDTVLRFCYLWQCRLYARASVQIHVPLCPFPKRDVRRRHADRDL